MSGVVLDAGDTSMNKALSMRGYKNPHSKCNTKYCNSGWDKVLFLKVIKPTDVYHIFTVCQALF